MLTTPIKEKEWQRIGINFCNKPVPDFLPIPTSTLEECVDFLHRAQGKVYVHCKAGVGRSASVVIAYYVKYKNMSVSEATAFVKKQRPSIHLNKNQQHQVHAYAVQTAMDSLPKKVKEKNTQLFSATFSRKYIANV